MQQRLLLLLVLLLHSARSFVQLQPLVGCKYLPSLSESIDETKVGDRTANKPQLMSELTDEAKLADQTANKDPELFVNGLTHDNKPGHAKFTRMLYKTLPLPVQHSARNNGGVRSLMDNGVTLSVSSTVIKFPYFDASTILGIANCTSIDS
jgi:hypothetical protein